MRIILICILLTCQILANAQSTITTTSVSGGSDGDNCVVSDIRTNLITLRNAGGLVQGCHYILTDHVQGRLVAGTTITLHADSPTEFSENVSVNTTYDNEGWRGIYDIDRNLVLELTDNRGNIARGFNGLEVANFDWGNTFITDVLVDNATWTTTYGATRTVLNCEFKNASVVNNTGQVGGTLNRVIVDNASSLNITNANISLLNFNMYNSSSLIASTFTGGTSLSNYNIYTSTINLQNSTAGISISNVYMYNSTFNHTGVTTGTVTGSSLTMNGSTTITHSNGALNLSLNRVTLINQSNINHSQGSISLSDYILENVGTVTQNTGVGGNISLSAGIITGSSSITNQSASNINGTRLQMYQLSTLVINNGATGTQTFTSTKFENQSSNTITATSTAGNTTVNQSTFSNQSFFQKTGIGSLTMINATFDNQARVILTNNRNLSMTRVYANNVVQIRSTATGVGITDAVTYCTLEDRCNISFSATGLGANSIIYTTMMGVDAIITFSGTTLSNTVQQCQLINGSIQMSNNIIAQTLVLATVSNVSNINCINMTVTTSMQRLQADNSSTITINNPTGAGSIIYINAYARGTINITGTATTSQDLYAEQGGAITHNGGQSIGIKKIMTGTLTTGNFNHNNLIMISPTSRTLTGANTNRSEYLGVVSSAPLF